MYKNVKDDMSVIKILWAVVFAFFIVLLYATLTSIFVTPFSDWYIGLKKPQLTPPNWLISLGWAINYLSTIIVLSKMFYIKSTKKEISLILLIGILNILWSVVFFLLKSLLGGILIQIAILLINIILLCRLAKTDIKSFLFFIVAVFWVAYVALLGLLIYYIN